MKQGAVFILFLMLLMRGILAFPQQYSLQTWSVEAGLAQSQVYAMLEDSRGTLWLGTNGGGISKFDGITFTQVKEQDGLPGNYIRALAEDSRGNIWIGTGNGLCRFNGREYTIIKTERGSTLPGVNRIVEDRQGLVWLATDKGIYRWNPSSQKVTRWGASDALPHLLTNDILFDKEGKVWVGTERGLAVAEAGWEKKSDLTFYKYRDGAGLGEGSIRSLREDSRGRVWITTYGAGVLWFDGSQRSLKDQRPFIRLAPQDAFRDIIVYESMEDKQGNIWFATFDGGAIRFDGKFFTRFTQTDGLLTNHVHGMVQDSWGNIWFGTSGGGVSKFAGDRFVHFTEKNGLSGNRVYSILQTAGGTILFGTSGKGLDVRDSTGFRHFGSSEGFADVVVKALLEDSRGMIWLGTEGSGAYSAERNGDGFVFKKYNKENGLGGNWVKDIFEDNRGNVWFAMADGGVTRYDGALMKNFSRTDGLTDERISCIAQDAWGMIWLGLRENGIMSFDGSDFVRYSKSNGLCDNAIRSITISADGTLYAGTENGISILTLKEGKAVSFACVTQKEGLTSNNIYLTLVDPNGDLWAGHEKGVDRLELENDHTIRQIKHFGFTEGFTGIETCQQASFLDREGNIWFGTMNGATRYNSTDKGINELPPKLQITSVHLFYEDITRTVYAGQKRSLWYSLPDSLYLPYHQNHLSFDFIGINFTNPEKVKYKWMLEGYDRDWTPVSMRREATYSNLAPGDYTFKVMAYNEDGIETEKPVTFSFNIRPPWWAAWWFRLAAGGLLVFLAYTFFQMRVRQLKARQRALQMEKSMLELEQKALRLQMNPHFIFNALNSIKGCMAEGDLTLARRNLVKFAQLMRLILDNSRAVWIALASEIKTLEHYLDLEALSRPGKFTYTIDVPEDIDSERLRIPPMLIQPFVENAVLHAIAPLDRSGHIGIRFEIRDGLVVCTVTDDGIGREKARALKESQRREHHSAGISVTEERLKLLQPEGGGALCVQFTDLKDANGNPCGTSVEISMPFQGD